MTAELATTVAETGGSYGIFGSLAHPGFSVLGMRDLFYGNLGKKSLHLFLGHLQVEALHLGQGVLARLLEQAHEVDVEL